jgi:hypothetical protein
VRISTGTLETVHLGQAEVEDDHVELVRAQRRVGLAAAAHLIDRIARVAQRTQQPIGQDLIVFGNQNAHGHPSERTRVARCAARPKFRVGRRANQGSSLADYP